MSRPANQVFAYGTLMFPEVVEALLGRAFSSRPARLVGYARLALRERVYPAIVARDGASTDGVLYAGVDDASLSKLDEFEGETYERRTVQVLRSSSIDPATVALAAEAYVIAPARLDLHEATPWDPEQFRALHHQRYVAHCRSLRAQGGGAVAFERRD